MKLNIKKAFQFSTMVFMACGLSGLTVGCSDFELTKTEADYDPRYQGTVDGVADYQVDAASHQLKVSFTSDMDWTAQVLNSEGEACEFASVSPESGLAGECEVTVTIMPNEDINNSRSAQLQIITEKGGTKTINIAQEYKVLYLDPAEIPDYAKYTCPGEWNPHFEEGPDYMLRHDSYYSWHRSKQSEHFFVFWSPEFGADPNSSDVPANMRVDIDDLLLKAEKFFDTNVNQLGMATLGQGKSMLDNYKMQIYLIYKDEWLATGSGYDDKIGALWINPSTCQPVGSTIAHEIGHSFQYQTYADRVQTQGVPADGTSGFRYGFVGPDGSGNGGCAYWEQCAQWQSFQDYPEEQFTSYNFPVWLNNCHRHFHHEFQRYASYWLQSYWVEKQGVESYGRLWRESVAPEDAIMAYTRIYNGNDYSKTREELFDYAVRMATYDIEGIRSYSAGFQNRYNPNFVRNDKGEYQITYDNCPGATGFNVIPLTVPGNGGKVSVKFRGLGYGEALCSNDKSNIEDGDGVAKDKPSKYNACGGAENMGWRYGFVAMAGDKRTYGSVGKEANGSLSFDVPAGADYLYLVVQGSPEVYMSHGWDEDETNDPQFPYAITLEGTDLANYQEPVAATYVEENGVLVGKLSVPVSVANEDWIAGTYDIAEKAVADFFGISVTEIGDKIVAPIVGEKQVAQEGKIVVFNEESDGSLSDMPTANVGYWLNADGNAVNWGNGHLVYYEINGSILTLGKLGAEAGAAGETRTMRPVFVYTKDGEAKTFKFIITYKYK
ncbi:MAG: DUF4859 domain-containing protein [Muribaculaceae bacterium]|nr:DUF4859 domain-containing protein [Muribaculaceae bacterium]